MKDRDHDPQCPCWVKGRRDRISYWRDFQRRGWGSPVGWGKVQAAEARAGSCRVAGSASRLTPGLPVQPGATPAHSRSRRSTDCIGKAWGLVHSRKTAGRECGAWSHAHPHPPASVHRSLLAPGLCRLPPGHPQWLPCCSPSLLSCPSVPSPRSS